MVLNDAFTIPVNPTPELIAEGLILCSIALLSFYAGYYAKIGSRIAARIPTGKQGFNESKIKRFAVFLEILGIILFAFWLYSARVPFQAMFALLPEYDYSSKSLLSEATPIGYFHFGEGFFIPAILLLVCFQPHKRWPLWIKLNFLLVLIFYTLTAARWRVLLLSFSVFFLYSLQKHKRVSLSKFIVIILLILVTMPIVGYYRSVSGVSKTVWIDFDTYIRSVLSSLSIFETFLVIIDAIPSKIDYLFGNIFFDILTYPIPRAIWPDKPFARELEIIWMLTGGRDLGYAAPNFGEFYMHFGVPGIILGMFLFGIISKAIYMYWKLNPESKSSQLILASVAPYLITLIDRGYLLQQLYIVFNIYIPLVMGLVYGSKPIVLKNKV
jgi:oligosaccharide repeat unit polymerase